MADRIHPYPMFPQSLTPNSLQQSQIPQQPPQSQQPDPQMIPALSNPEHAHMWQQMNQLQSPYRSQQSGDLTTPQMNHQMQEFTRGQALPHTQGQSMIQQSFGFNAQRMNPPVFHDPQAGQSQSLIPSNFPNVSMNTQQQMKAPFNMNPMMQGLNNRQLKMLSQQEVARLHQQSSLGAQHAPNHPPNQQPSVDMFVPPPMQSSQDQLHNPPHPSVQPVGPPGPNQGMVPGNPQQNVQKRMLTPAEFHERRNFLLASITQAESNLTVLVQAARNAGSVDTLMQSKINHLRAELHSRKEMYSKFVTAYGAMVAQQMTNGIPLSNIGHVNSMVHSTSQPQANVPGTQAQPSFVTPPNQAQYNMSTTSSIAAQGQGTSNQRMPIQSPHTHVGRPNTIPPRNGGTPHQITGNQLPNALSPNLGNLAAQSGQVVNQTQQSVVIKPLDKQRFESTYAQFCRSQGINPALSIAMGENRQVDLHQLHVHVMHEAGGRSVTMRDMWPVIGGRLGFIQFPGNDAEPARCGPGIAQQLQNTYERHLQHFENAYVLTVKNRSAAGSSQQALQVNVNPLAIDNNTTTSLPGATEMPSNPPRPQLNQQIIYAAARHAHTSAQDMRAQGVQEAMIAFVERHRPELQKVQQQYQAQVMAKRTTELEQQNIRNASGQLSSMHDPSIIGSQAQRHVGPNPMVSMNAGDTKVVNGSFPPENGATGPQKPLPTQDQIQQAIMTTGHFKQTFYQRPPAMPYVLIPDEHRAEYNQLLEQVFKSTSALDPKLPMYFLVFKSEDVLRRYVAIVLTVAKQRQIVHNSPPQYIIRLETLRAMQVQIHKLNEEFDNRWRAMRTSYGATNTSQLPSLPSTVRINSASPLTVPPVQNASRMPAATQSHPPGRPISINPPPQPSQPQSSSSQSQLQPSSTQLQSQLSQPQSQASTSQPLKKPFHPSIPPSPLAQSASATIASPTPPPAAASSSTPAASAPTPQTAAASPQTPKSPPSKAVTKTKTATRTNRRPSAVGKSPAAVEVTPSIAGVKRPSPEEVGTLTSVAPSEAEACNAPSPKKAKTEWEGEASEALAKRQQEVDNIKAEEDTTAFFDRMRELFTMTASTDQKIHHDIASTLDQILAGMAQEPAGAAATAAALSVHGVGDVGPPPTALSPHMGPANDAFLEFIDFSSFATLEDEDGDSKAPTPDLVPSSETNPSPESGSEGDLSGGAGSPDKIKIEESADRSDPLRLGSLKEIDGGESAYYQVDNWKWEGPMHTLDQPWAIFTS